MNHTQAIETKWYKLDNAAKIYPAISTDKDSCVFRVALNLKKNVRPDILQQAVNDCRNRFPAAYVRLRHGLFWYYYETNEKEPTVKRESCFLNAHIDAHKNNGYDFTFFYYQNRISLETFHGLTDASGASVLLSAVVYRYFQLCGYTMQDEGLISTIEQQPPAAEAEDGFLKYRNNKDKTRTKICSAYRIRGARFERKQILAVINGKMKTSQLKEAAKRYDASITQYVAALLTHCIWLSASPPKRDKNPINLSVPVNLRKFYGLDTLRNFALFFYTSFLSDGTAVTFEKVLKKIKMDFASELRMEKLQQNLNANVAMERTVAFFPLCLKKWAVRIGNHFLGDLRQTATISNLGEIKFPDSFSEHINDFEFHLPVRTGLTNNIAVVSVCGVTTISFTRKIYKTEIERLFFSHLAGEGIDVEIQSNLAEQYA